MLHEPRLANSLRARPHLDRLIRASEVNVQIHGMNGPTICLRCHIRASHRFSRHVLRPKRLYSQSVENILDESPSDALTGTLDKAFKHDFRGPRSSDHSFASLRRSNAKPRQETRLKQRSSPSRPLKKGLNGAKAHSKNQRRVKRADITRGDHVTEIGQLVEQGDLAGAWKYYLESSDTSWNVSQDVHDSSKPNLLAELDAVLKALSQATWTELEKDSPDAALNEAIPSPLAIWQAIESRVSSAHNKASMHAASIATMFMRLRSLDKDVFGTMARRQCFHNLFDFWNAWVKRNRNGARPPPARTHGFLPQNPKFKYLKDDPPIFHHQLYRFVDDVDIKRSPVMEIVFALQDALEYGLKNSDFAPEFKRYEPFVQDLNVVLGHSKYTQLLQEILAKELLRHRVPEDYVGTFLQRLGAKAGVNSAELSKIMVKLPPDDLDVLALKINTSLGRYLERQNLDLTEKLWRSFQDRLPSWSSEEKDDPAMCGIFEDFLLTFRALRRSDQTVNVWNTMVRSGLTPTTRTWNVMLKGCHIGREVEQMEQLWVRMLRAGIQPNAISWATRIHGLFKFGMAPEGFRALSDVSHKSRTPQRSIKEQPSVSSNLVEPTVEIMNSALSGAIHLGPEFIGRIFAWGRKQGLEPDLVTYNILINVALHQGNPKSAYQIMARMKEKGIEPNSATFTVLLHALLTEDFLADMSPAEQESQVMSFIRNCESEGLVLDKRSYAMLLDRLLKLHGNNSAARTVLNHMIERGIEPTAHMYTILITHYFSREPPDVEAVEGLWQRITRQPNHVLDVIFYDRMLEGYARVNEMGKVMYFLTRMSKEGKRPGWVALTEVLRCILLQGDVERAKELVLDVKRTEGAVRAGIRGRAGYEDFWSLVSEARL